MEKFIVWVEIPTTDFTRALKFYNYVFNLSLQPLEFGSEKMAFFPNGEGVIYHSEDSTPSPDGATVSFLVPDSIEKTLERAK